MNDSSYLLGPDSQGHHKTTITPGGAGLQTLVLDFYASELRLRGDDPVEQPHEKDGDVLCWNGGRRDQQRHLPNALTNQVE